MGAVPVWVVRAVTGLALVVAAALLYFAFDAGAPPEPPVRRGAVLRVFPEPGAVALRQDAIGVELAFGYNGSLTIDRRPIPDDQLDVVEGINRVSFTPGDGKDIEQLDEGRHCAEITYVAIPTEDATDTTPSAPYSWCFIAA